jgi:hypothetical protein
MGRGRRVGLWVALAAVALGVGGVAFLGYVVPADARSGWHLNHAASRHFRAAVPGAERLPVLTESGFHLGFRIALVLAWGGYAGLVVACGRPGPLPRRVLWAAGGLSLVALPTPPYLTTDTYSYAADGRLYWLHGLNPMAAVPAAIPEDADPVREVIDRDVVHPYGPGWTVVECAVVGVLLWAGLVGQLVGFKLVAGAAVVGAAFAARGVTRRLAPEYADLAFLAVTANPMLLIEGPGQGHNDLLMMAVFAGAVWAAAAGRWTLAGLGLGLAAAVKLLPLAAVPWLALAAWRQAGWKRAGVVVLAALLPLPVLYLPFARDARFGESVVRAGGAVTDPAVRQRDGERKAALEANGVPGPVAGVLVSAARQPVVLGLYLAATAFVVASRSRRGAWVEAWVALAAGFALLLTGRVFPWYPAWMLVPAACLANRYAVPAVGFGTILGLLLVWRYTLVW